MNVSRVVKYYLISGLGWLLHNLVALIFIGINYSIYFSNFVGFFAVNFLIFIFHQTITFSRPLNFYFFPLFYFYQLTLLAFANILFFLAEFQNLIPIWAVLFLVNFVVAILSFFLSNRVFLKNSPD